MKLPITDKFLWEMYRIFEKAGDVISAPRHAKLDALFGLENPVFRKYKHQMGEQKFSKLIYYLKRNNYIKAKALENKKGFMLTKEGISKALKASFEAGEKQKRNDGKWAMIIFDVPQKHPKARNLLKSILTNLGYKLLQQSVWVTPYNVSKTTEELLQLHDLERYVKVFLIEEM